MRKQRDKSTYHRLYDLPEPYGTRYARSKAQAKYRQDEWAFTPESWYAVWCDSGVIEHMGRSVHQYCMVRVDDTEAWGPHNTIIIPRRMHFKKRFYEYVLNYPKTEYDPTKHAYYCPPQTLEKYNVE